MKEITQERILNAIERSGKLLHKKPEFHVCMTMFEIGFRSALGGNNPITDKDRLELAYQGFSDPEQIFKRLSRIQVEEGITSLEAIKKAWISSFEASVDRHHNRVKRILDLQVKHNISSLEPDTINLGDKVLTYHIQNNLLRQTHDDFVFLDNERIKVVRAFLCAARKYNMKIWLFNKKTDNWEPIKRRRVFFKACAKAWAICWERKYYINQQELHQNGFANLKSELTSIHDKLTWEFHLSLGIGDQEADTDTTWLCANLGDEPPSR